MKSVIVIFCIAGTLVGWLATHLGTSTKIVRNVGDGWNPESIQTAPPPDPPKTVPVNAKKTSEPSKN